MKSKIILVVMIIGVFYSPSSFSMQKQKDQGYWQRIKDYIKDYVTQSQSRIEKRIAETERLDPEGFKRSKRIISNAMTAGKIGATLGLAYPLTAALMHPDRPEGEATVALLFTVLGGALYSSINDIWNYYWQTGALSEGELIEEIKKNVKENLFVHCPTKKTRLKMLAQDYLVVEALKKNGAASQQEKLKASMMQKALKQLTHELNSTPEAATDTAIDDTIQSIEEGLSGTTEEKIATLNTDFMQAVNYLLYRLNLELTLEKIKKTN